VAISSVLVETSIPARLDRLRWGRFHTLVVVALGITWILDGLEVTLAGAVSPALSLRFSNADVGHRGLAPRLRGPGGGLLARLHRVCSAAPQSAKPMPEAFDLLLSQMLPCT
jgi:hypothetical protein